MRYQTEKQRIGILELTFLLLGIFLILLLSYTVNGQGKAPLYREYRGVHLGMTAAEARAKLGEPVMKSNDQDFYVLSANETAQIAYDQFQKVVTISTDYTAGVGAPDYRTVVGTGLLEKPDGSLFRMVQYQSEGFWVSYNKSAAGVPVVTITIQMLR
jgi:hypothetical protein